MIEFAEMGISQARPDSGDFGKIGRVAGMSASAPDAPDGARRRQAKQEDVMVTKSEKTRRVFLLSTAGVGSALYLNACGDRKQPATQGSAMKKPEGEKGGSKEVMAAEDLMREHGVLRRALLVYAEAATRLRRDPGSVPLATLQNTAELFRTFGEDYHEKKLEEAFIFPAIRRAGGPAASYLDILVAQHGRGREITDYISSATRGLKLGGNAGNLAAALDGFVRMYQFHAAREDTVIFPAWKETVSDEQYDELSDKFEEIEHQNFGADGFGDAVKKIGEIEGTLALSDLAQFTAPAPPANAKGQY